VYDWGEDIPFYDQVWDGRTDTPHATPLEDLLAASDAAAMDAECMDINTWLETAHELAYV
jgi:hypothetical protein